MLISGLCYSVIGLCFCRFIWAASREEKEASKYEQEMRQSQKTDHGTSRKRHRTSPYSSITIYEPWYEISNNVLCATSKVSDQPALTGDHRHFCMYGSPLISYSVYDFRSNIIRQLINALCLSRPYVRAALFDWSFCEGSTVCLGHLSGQHCMSGLFVIAALSMSGPFVKAGTVCQGRHCLPLPFVIAALFAPGSFVRAALYVWAFCQGCHICMGKNFRIIPEFKILRLTFYGKSASKCWIKQILIASLIYFQIL